ncbi:Gfo/Idh/MocA family oxidoreductase [soil metagenome]
MRDENNAEVSEPVRWGVLSTAKIAREKVIPAIARSELANVVAIASRSEEPARKVAQELGIDRAYGSYEDLLADPEIEAVYIPLPNHLHGRWTKAAAMAGKHVLCEKPLATSSAEAREMIASCDRAGVKLMEAFMYRLHPLWVKVRGLVRKGAVGDVLAIQGFFAYRNLEPDNIRNIVETGGGALLDIGCYPVNVSRMLFGGEPNRVEALIRRDPAFGTDVLTSVLLDFDSRHATFTCSTQLEDDQRIHIQGTKGRLTIEIPFNIPPDRPTRILHFAGGKPPTEPGVTIHEVPAADQYTVQVDAFSHAVRHDTPVPTPPEDAVANLEVLERIVAAAG